MERVTESRGRLGGSEGLNGSGLEREGGYGEFYGGFGLVQASGGEVAGRVVY